MRELGESGSSPNLVHYLEVNPLEEPGWDALVNTHPETCFFHGSSWARVLHDSYGHRPIYFCKTFAGRLKGLLPIMEICSRLTGARGVSLPFTDFCPPINAGHEPDWNPYTLAIRHGKSRGWRYLECRGCGGQWPGASPSLSFYGHFIRLDEGEGRLFKNLKGPIRTGFRKAQAAKLRVEFNSDREAVLRFYSLHCLTRRRHGLPPQPLRFFENIAQHVLARGQGVVVSAFMGEQAVASALFLHHEGEVFFKFGASDYAFQSLRPNNLVMWEGIKRYANEGFKVMHLGRTSCSNAGLRRFKRGFGAVEEVIHYYKYDLRKGAFVSATDYASGPANHFFKLLSLPTLRLAGRLLYPHVS